MLNNVKEDKLNEKKLISNVSKIKQELTDIDSYNKENNWILSDELNLITRKIREIEPFGFYDDVLTEGLYLSYENSEDSVASVCVIRKNERPILVTSTSSSPHNIRVSTNFDNDSSLMSAKAFKQIQKGKTVDLRSVDQQIEDIIRNHLFLETNEEYLVVKRWIEATYFYDIFDAFPILFINGLSGTGKSRLLEIIYMLSYHGKAMTEPTIAAFFRTISKFKPTLTIDEGEQISDNENLRRVLNSCYTKSGSTIIRCVGDNYIPTEFNFYGPVAIASINPLYYVTQNRTIRIQMIDARQNYPHPNSYECDKIRDNLYQLRLKEPFKVREIYKTIDMNNIVTARFEELFIPLFTIANLFGTQEEWKVLADWAKKYEKDCRSSSINNSPEADILSATIIAYEITNTDGWIYISTITNISNNQYGQNRFNPRTISGILRLLGFEIGRDGTGTKVYISKSKLDNLKSR